MVFFRQLRLVLWKTWILKKRAWGSTLGEIFIPVLFMLLMAWLKSLSTVSSDPNVAYVCDGLTENCNAPALTCPADNDWPTKAEFVGFNVGNEEDIFFSPGLQRMVNVSHAADKILVVAPQTAGGQAEDVAQDFLQQLQETYYDPWGVLTYMDSQSDLDSYVGADDYEDEGVSKVAGAIVFLSGEPDWDYSIRLNYTLPWVPLNELFCFTTYSYPVGNAVGTGARCATVPTTTDDVDSLETGVDAEYVYGYSTSGFLTLQKAVDDYILQKEQTIYMALFPTEAYSADNFEQVISSVLGLFYMLSFLFPVSRLIRGILIEKETRIKEGMKMMGLLNSVFYSGWLISAATQFFITSVIITVVTRNNVFEYSNGTLVFIWFFSFSLSIISLCFLTSVFFSKSKTGAVMGTLVFFATFFPYYAVNDASYSEETKIWGSLLAPTCFALGTTVFADFEGGHVGVTWHTFSSQTSNYSYETCIIMLLFDFFLYGALAWYLDKVLPSEYGTHLVWYFPFTKEYWAGPEPLTEVEQPMLSDVERGANDENAKHIEPVPAELRYQEEDHRCLQVKSLRKVFQTTAAERVAVKGLNMTLYEGQISILLGHNGAGKSTTISMLTGLIPPTSGDAIVAGQSINHSMKDIRKSLGVCPQHDILFPSMTVKEHLQMFAGFKGVPADKVDTEVERMIAEVGLTEKSNIRSEQLSGGQKRKLSVGIALIGDSRVVILDEPTSGMDPYSRRSTWNILQKNKAGRLILMTTHFMDEADILGDRIAIMSHGELRCCGSSLFLKSHYGVGYTLTVVTAGQGTDTSAISRTVKAHVADADQLSHVGAELSFRLPLRGAPAFRELFNDFEAQKDAVGITSYGISVTTMEEVFLRVGRGTADASEKLALQLAAEQKEKYHTGGSGSQSGAVDVDSAVTHEAPSGVAEGSLQYADQKRTRFWDAETGRVQERRVFLAHLTAMLYKRFIYAKRDKKTIFFQLIIPVVVVLLGLILLKVSPTNTTPSLQLEPYSEWNTELSNVQYRNFVPFIGPSSADGYASLFDGDSVDGVLVNVTGVATIEQFDDCAQGNEELLTLSNFLLENAITPPASQHGASIYGAFAVPVTPSSFDYAVLVNSSAIHGAPILINLVSNAMLKSQNPDNSITVRNYPLPQTALELRFQQGADNFTAALMVMIAFSFIPASFAIFVVKEREVKAKHQQVISGVSLWAYWISTFLWDSLSYMLPAFLSVLLFVAFDIEAFIHGNSLAATIMLFVLFGPAIAGSTYCISFIFKSHSSAQNIILSINFMTGMVLMIASFVMSFLSSTHDINAKLKYVYRLFPGFCLADGLSAISVCSGPNSCPIVGSATTEKVSPWNWDVAGADVLYLGLESVIFMGVCLLIEYGLTFPKLVALITRAPVVVDEEEERDEDVVAEEERVARGDADGEIIKISGLRKVYPSRNGPKVAVRNLSFGIPKGECFGFLGINGAGKTTTLSILSGEFPQTRGEAFIAGFNISEDQSNIRRRIGYCPQFDALLELLTVQEHLEMYARIKGVPESELRSVVQGKIAEMDLVEFADKAAGSLSGGNKRKLSVAIALIGEPSIIFLDEPSTGVDPVARRFLWQVLSKLSTQDGQCSIILTTHSMEEAEALCTRIGIMVNGGLRCLGSPQHLKARFGDAFEVNLILTLPAEEEVEALLRRIRSLALLSGEVSLTTPLTPQDLDRLCAALGDEERRSQISETGSGHLLVQQLRMHGCIELEPFIEWWITEDKGVDLIKFFTDSFAGATVLEHATSNSFRIKLPRQELTLAFVFGHLEDHKEQVHISEYSLGMTSLEQIFNGFAASQLNPENHHD